MNLKHFIFYFIFASFFASCKHDPIAPIAPNSEPVKWTLHPATMGNWFITNQFYKDSNQLTVVGTDYRFFLDTAHQIVQQTGFKRLVNNAERVKPFVGKTFFAYPEAEHYYSDDYPSIKIFSTANPLISSTIHIQNLGRYHTILNYREPSCVVTNEHRLYLPVMDTTGRALFNGATCYLLVLKLTLGTDSIAYQLEDRLPIQTLTPRFKEWGYTNLQLLPNNEIGASIMGTGYRINTVNKAITPLFPMLYGKLGYLKDTLCAIGCEDTPNVDVLRLNVLVNGQSQWQAWNLYGLPAVDLRWYFLENELLAVYQYRQIYHVTRGNDKTYLTPIDCSFIEGIQDITYFKGRVYIASKQGLYYKSWKDFWTYL